MSGSLPVIQPDLAKWTYRNQVPATTHLAPWQLFAWETGKLTATIPPGRFASVCSLMAGTYVYTTSTVGVGAKQPGAGGVLPEKAQIVVK